MKNRRPTYIVTVIKKCEDHPAAKDLYDDNIWIVQNKFDRNDWETVEDFFYLKDIDEIEVTKGFYK